MDARVVDYVALQILSANIVRSGTSDTKLAFEKADEFIKESRK